MIGPIILLLSLSIVQSGGQPVPCEGESLKQAETLANDHLIVRVNPMGDADSEILDCYVSKDGPQVNYSIHMRIDAKECRFSLNLVYEKKVFIVTNQASLRGQASQCTAFVPKEVEPEKVELIETKVIDLGTTVKTELPTLSTHEYPLDVKAEKQSYQASFNGLKETTETHIEEMFQETNPLQKIVQTHGIEKAEQPQQISKLLGGWQQCTEAQRTKYIGATLTALNQNPLLFTAAQTLKCQIQLVAGLNVKITFGASQEESCHAHLFYPLNKEEPEVDIRRSLCLPKIKRPLLGAPSVEEKCSRFTILKSLDVFKKKVSDPKLKDAYLENMKNCVEQFADGTKVHMSLEFNKKPCEFYVFFSPDGEDHHNGAINCSA